MSRAIDVYFQSSLSPRDTVFAFLSQLMKLTNRASDYRVVLNTSNNQDQNDIATDYGLYPTVDGFIEPPSGLGDDLVYLAALRMTEEIDTLEFIFILQGVAMLAFRRGIVYLNRDEEAFFRKYVLEGLENLDARSIQLLPDKT